MDELEKQIAGKILDRILSNEGIMQTDQYDGYLQMIYDNLKAIQVQAVVMPNEVIGGGHLTDKEFETLSVRITPAFYDIDLDGATNCKGDVLRKLRIIFNDIIDSRREA